jgi:hypothetical protein
VGVKGHHGVKNDTEIHQPFRDIHPTYGNQTEQLVLHLFTANSIIETRYHSQRASTRKSICNEALSACEAVFLIDLYIFRSSANDSTGDRTTFVTYGLEFWFHGLK